MRRFFQSARALAFGVLAWVAVVLVFSWLAVQHSFLATTSADHLALIITSLRLILSYGVATLVAARLAPQHKHWHSGILSACIWVAQNILTVIVRDVPATQMALSGALTLALAAIGSSLGSWLGWLFSPPRNWEDYGQAIQLNLADGSAVEVRSARRSLAGAATVYGFGVLGCLALMLAFPRPKESVGAPSKFGLLGMAFAAGSFSVARRLHTPILSKALGDDVRLILYLRAFDADQAHWQARGEYDLASTSVEKALCKRLKKLGTVVALGKPGEALPPEGATRVYVRCEDWQAVVMHLLGRAKSVVLRLADTPNVRWELQQCMAELRPEQFALFVQHAPGRSRADVYRAYRSGVGAAMPAVLPDELGDSCLICFGDHWEGRLVPRDMDITTSMQELGLSSDHCLQPVLWRIATDAVFYPNVRSANDPTLIRDLRRERIAAMAILGSLGLAFFGPGLFFIVAHYMHDDRYVEPIDFIPLGVVLLMIGGLFGGLAWHNRK